MLVLPTPPLPVYRRIRVIAVHDGAMAEPAPRAERTDVELLDAGEGRRLERFGPVVVDRPAPVALAWRRDQAAWRDVDLRFDPEDGLVGRGPGDDAAPAPMPWPVEIAGLTMELRPRRRAASGCTRSTSRTSPWLEEQVGERLRGRRRAAGERAEPVRAHRARDPRGGPRGSGGRARRRCPDGDRLGAPERRAVRPRRPARFAGSSTTRRRSSLARRAAGRRYDGIVLDPPSFGHAGRRRWRLEDELPDLLTACAAVARGRRLRAPDRAHDRPRWRRASRAWSARRSPPAPPGSRARPSTLVATSGARLELGWSVRVDAR